MPEIATKFTKKFASEKSCDFNKLFNDIFSKLPEAEFYLVGGMTRDILLNKPKGKDYDFVCRNVPLQKLINALGTLGTVDLVGANFGVLKFLPANAKLKDAIDIALPRKDFATGTGGYRDMEAQADPAMPIEEDLSRRDITINAMAWDIKNQKLIDPFNGQADLANKIIRCVGDAEKRFHEDYSRMLRAIRFACRFNFKIEDKTWNAIKTLMPKINGTRMVDNKEQRIVPAETIGKEIMKSLKDNPRLAIKLLDESRALDFIMPELLATKGCEQPHKWHSEGDVWTHTMLILEKMETTEFKKEFPKLKIKPDFILALLLHDAGKAKTRVTVEENGEQFVRFYGHDIEGAKIAKTTCERLKLSRAETNKIVFLVRNHMVTMQGNIAGMKSTTIEKYYMGKHGQDLLTLLWLDALCSVREDGLETHQNYRDIKTRVQEMKNHLPTKSRGSTDLLSGDEIMAVLNIKPSKRIAEIKEQLRELQLNGKLTTKEAAMQYLKNL
ncbi:CCA tRNA nucleotidyltransferase [Candidatus Falkowbacteria bacterium]|nr:CCA tRNA nucleotidyltransferase [Candidatus Falkowbacteria bacterium]